MSNYKGRKGPRPHTWKIQGQVPHEQFVAWHKMRAQANFRGEHWDLSFEDFQTLWQGRWDNRGRGSDDYCLAREDPDGGWDMQNTFCIERIEHLRRQRLYKSRRKAHEKTKYLGS